MSETDLVTMLRGLDPEIRDGIYVFCTVKGAVYGALAHTSPLACMVEREGLSLVMTKDQAESEGLAYQGIFRCISLRLHSSLEAVGLTAAIASELAKQGISANVIAGHHHDHVLVPAIQADRALHTLNALKERAWG